MGNTSDKLKKIEVVRQPQQPDPWKVIDNIGYCQIVKHLQTQQIAQSYTIPLDLRVKLEEQYQKYQYRRTNNEYLIKIYQVSKRNSQYLCSGLQFLNIKTQRIQYRLNQIRKLTQKQGVYLMYCCLIGFKRIKQLLQPLKVDQNMIGVTPTGQIRVWLNQNIAKNYPQLQYELNSQVTQEKAQKIMLQKIVQIIINQIAIESQQFQQIKHKLNHQQLNNFDEAINICKYIGIKLNVNFKNMRINMKNIKNIISSQQTTQKQQSVPMQVSNIKVIQNQIPQQNHMQDSFNFNKPQTPMFYYKKQQQNIIQQKDVNQLQTQDYIIKVNALPHQQQKQIDQSKDTEIESSPVNLPTVINYELNNQNNGISQNSYQRLRQSQQQKSIFPIINKSKSKGKPPKPILKFKQPNLSPRIPNQVIQTINSIENSRISQKQKSLSRSKKQVAFANTQIIKPSESPLKNKSKIISKSQQKQSITKPQFSKSPNINKKQQQHFQEQKYFKQKPFTTVNTLQTPIQNIQMISSSFSTNSQRPFNISKPQIDNNITVRSFYKDSFQYEYKKYSSLEKNKTQTQLLTPNFNISISEIDRTLQKSKSSHGTLGQSRFDVDQYKGNESKIMEPSFRSIPQSNKPVSTQYLSQKFKGALNHRLDLSQYTYKI